MPYQQTLCHITVDIIIKEEAHGPHCSPETQFQSKNSFKQSYNNEYTITLIKRKWNNPYFKKLESPSPKGVFCAKFG